jgi:carbon storage regulator
MLVLTRKVGQQIILPECGVTIDIVDLSKNHVRLGIVAPTDVPVHRTEVWQRIRHGDARGSVDHGDPDQRNLWWVDTPDTSGVCGSGQDNIAHCLAEGIARRTGGRIRCLSVHSLGNRIIVSGSCSSYHVRQLAQAAVNEIITRRPASTSGFVEYKLDVVDSDVDHAQNDI